MLTLFYAPGACSIAPHIALLEAGVAFTLAKVDFLRGKRLGDGRDFTSVNPKGQVPALVLENGELLTEAAVMVQYIADLKPASNLAPACGTFARVRMQEWLNFLATELHKGMSPLYKRTTPEEYKALLREHVAERFKLLEVGVTGKPFLLGDQYTVADSYAFYCLRSWKRVFKNELTGALGDYYGALAGRAAVQAAVEAEGFGGV